MSEQTDKKEKAKESPKQECTEVKCSIPLLNEILTLLQKRPYEEVSVVMDKIKNGGFVGIVPTSTKGE